LEANTVKYVEARDVEILTAPEAATYLKVRPSWLYEAARARRVPDNENCQFAAVF